MSPDPVVLGQYETPAFSCPKSPAPSIDRNTLRCVRSPDPDHRCDDPQPSAMPSRQLRGGLCAGAVAMTVA
eukprot:7141846-Prymnesium_polylepis.1